MNIDYFIKSAAPMQAGSADHKALVQMLSRGLIDQNTFDLAFKNGIVPTISPSIIKNRSMVTSSPDHRELVRLLNSGLIDQNAFDLAFTNGIVPTIAPMPKQKPVALTDLERLAAGQSVTLSGQDPTFNGLIPETKIPALSEAASASPLDVRIPGSAVADSTSNFTDLKNLDATSSATLSGRDFNFGSSMPNLEINPFPGETSASPLDIRIPEGAVADGVIDLKLFGVSKGSTPKPSSSSKNYSIPSAAVDAAVLPGDIFNTPTGVNTDNKGFSLNQLLPEGHRANGSATLTDEMVQNIKKQVAADKAKVPAKAVADGAEDVTRQMQEYKALGDAAQRAKELVEAAALQAATTTPAQTTNSSDTLQKYLLWGGLGAGALGLAGYLAGRNNNKKKKQRRPYAMPPVQQQMMQGQYPYQGAMQGRYPTY